MTNELDTRPIGSEPKYITWLKRYGPAEIGGIMGAYLGFFLATILFDQQVANSYGGSIGETIGYYGIFIFQVFLQPSSFSVKTRILHLFSEFGPAELIDAIFLRPLFIGIAVYYVGSIWGILIGKLLADITFYVPVIITFELRNHYYRSRK